MKNNQCPDIPNAPYPGCPPSMGKVKHILLIPNARRKDVNMVLDGKHPKFKTLQELIEKVNTDKRYKSKFAVCAS